MMNGNNEEWEQPKEAFFNPQVGESPDVTVPETTDREGDSPIEFFQSGDKRGSLFYAIGAQWYRIDAHVMDGSARAVECSPDADGTTLEPCSQTVNEIFRPVREYVVDAFEKAIEGLPIQEMERLIVRLLLDRNFKTYKRKSAASSVFLNERNIQRRYLESWFYQYPDGTLLDQEAEEERRRQREQEARERASAREDPEKGRLLQQREFVFGGLVTCPIVEGYITDVPLWEAHKRGRNWAAKIASDRTFLKAAIYDQHHTEKPEGGPRYLVANTGRGAQYTLIVGDVVEFAGDYHSIADEKVSTRRYYRIESLDGEKVDFRPLAAKTTEEAVREAKTK